MPVNARRACSVAATAVAASAAVAAASFTALPTQATPPFQPEIILDSAIVAITPEDAKDDAITMRRLAALQADPNQTFSLESRPGSSKTLFLDFDGARLEGTGWNKGSDAIPPTDFAQFSLDSNASSLSTEEHAFIQLTWAAVVEDFAGLDVNVTTRDLGVDAIERSSTADNNYGARAIITSSPTSLVPYCGQVRGCVGLAYVDVFTATSPGYRDALVFAAGGLSRSVDAVSQTASHELGHTLGLSHHGDGGRDYTRGNSTWVPIMGSGVSGRLLSQWSDGKYPSATNPNQDDLAVITGPGKLQRLNEDDREASNLSGSVTGIIGSPSDVDTYQIPASPATRTLTVEFARVNNLSARIRGLDSAGNAVVDQLVTTTSRTTAATPAPVDIKLPPAVTAVSVSAGEVRVGSGATTATSTYGSRGSYTLTLSGGSTPTPPSKNLAAKVTPGFFSATTFTPVNQKLTYAITGGSGPYTYTAVTGTPPGLTVDKTTGQFTGTPTSVGRFTVVLRVSDAAGASVDVKISVSVRAATFKVLASNNTYDVTAGSRLDTSVTYTITGGSGTYVFSATRALPAGLSLSETTGQLSGVPSKKGRSLVGVKVTDSVTGKSSTAYIRLTVK